MNTKPKEKTPASHKLEFNSRFLTPALFGGNSRTFRKNKKAIAAIKPGDLIELVMVEPDGAKTHMATAPVLEVYPASIDEFGMTLRREGSNPYRTVNLQGLATLFGFETHAHMTEFYREIGYVKDGTSFEGTVICWDPTQLKQTELDDPARIIAKAKPDKPPTAAERKAAEEAARKAAEDEAKRQAQESEFFGPFLIAELPDKPEEWDKAEALRVKAVGEAIGAYQVLECNQADIEEGDLVFQDKDGKELLRGDIDDLEAKLKAKSEGKNAE